MNHIRATVAIVAAAVIISILAGGCSRDSGPTRPNKSLTLGVREPLSAAIQAQVKRDQANIDAMHGAIREAVEESNQNADKWFGPKSQRTHERVCDGVEKLLRRTIRKADERSGR